MKHLIAWTAILLVLAQANSAVAIDCAKNPPIDGENPIEKRTGMFVGGIITTSIAAPVAIVSGLIVGYSISDCGHGDGTEDSEPNCRKEGRGWTVGTSVAAVVLATGIVGGIRMIRIGKEGRNAWYEWEEKCAPKEPQERAEAFEFAGIGIESDRQTGTSLGLNFRF